MRPDAAILLSACLLGAACATAPVATPAKCETTRSGLSFEEAQEIVAQFEARQSKAAAGHPLRDPKSLEQVLEILKLDDMTLFPAGVAYATASTEPGAKALAAQLQLAWGDSMLTVGRLMHELASKLEGVARHTESQSDPVAVAVRDQLAETRGVAEALARLASEHLAAGRKLAREVIAAAPNDYQGYRVAADYYLLLEEWDEFDAMVAKIETLNPGSNGLAFLRGVAAFERHGDVVNARTLLSSALTKDPQFVRAQAQLVRVQPTFREAYAEFRKLAELSPNHQLVVWAGEYMETVWAANQRERGAAPVSK